MGTLLVDGFYRGTWRIVRHGGRARLRVEPFRRLARHEADALTEEGARLLREAAPLSAARDSAPPDGAAPDRAAPAAEAAQ